MTDDEWNERFQRVYNQLVTTVGYFSIAEGETHGLTPSLRAEAIARGVIVAVDDAVVRIAMHPAVPQEKWICGWLRCGRNRILLSHTTALAIHGLAADADDVHVTISETRELPDVVPPHLKIHRGVIDGWDAERVGLLPVTSIARTLRECEEIGVDPAILAPGKDVAVKKRLIPGDTPNGSPAIADGVVRAAICEEQRTDEPEDDVGTPLRRLVVPLDGELVRDLTGIDYYAALEVVSLPIEPTARLDVLLALPRLVRVRLQGARSDEPVLAELRARGVVVDVGVSAAPGMFADPMLALAVLEALITNGQLAKPVVHVIDEYEMDRENLARLAAYPFTTMQLASIERLVWEGGGMSIQHLLWPQWDGETDELDLHSLAGIEKLPNLRELVLQTSMPVPEDELVALRNRGITVTGC